MLKLEMSEFEQILEFKFKMKQEGQRILEAAQHLLATSENPHFEYTALKPLDERLEESIHPARIVNPEDRQNYFSYSWNSDQEGIGALNWLCLSIAVTGIAVLVYMLAKTQILKFIQFFVTHRYYERIALSMKPEGASTFEQSQFKIKLQDQTERSTIATNSKLQQKLTNFKRVFTRTKVHAIPLAQFYTPIVAIFQRLLTKDNQVDNAVVLPGYMQAFQIGSRAILLVPLSLIFMLLCVSSKCAFSRNQLNFSYECLNEYNGEQNANIPFLIVGGLVAAIITSILMFNVSRSIFQNYMDYLAKFKLPEECIQPMQEVKISINNSSSRKKSSSNKRKMQEDNLKRASVTSFQALLGQDASSLGIESDTESHYDSRMSQNNSILSTNLNNTQTTNTERLLLASQHSERSMLAGPKKFQSNNPNLNLIEEDEEEQKCSPIKPKRRTRIESPFKKNFEEDSNSEECCGAELDRGSPLDLNLNDLVREEDQILETPQQKVDSPTKFEQNNKVSAFGAEQLQLPALHDGEDDGNQSEGFTLNKIENLRQSYETGLVLNAQSISENVDYETMHKNNKNNRNQGKINQQSIGSGEDSTLAFDSLVPGLSIPNSAKNTKEIKEPQSVKHATTGGSIGMGLSLAMKNFNRDGNCETQSQDQELSSMRRIDLVSNQGSRPNSVEMINRASDPVIFEQIFEEIKKPEGRQKIDKLKDKIYWCFVFVGALMILFGIILVLYCMVNLSNYGLRLFMVTVTSAIAFDAAIQLTILIGISAKQVKCELTQQPLAYNISPIAQLTKETFSILSEIFDNYQEPNALLQVQFDNSKDLDDQLLDQIAKDLDLECGTVTPRNNKPDPKLELIKGDDRKSDILLVKKQTFLNSHGIVVDFTETTKFKSPNSKAEIKTNIVSPNANKKAKPEPLEDQSPGEELDIYKRKRQIENQIEKQSYLSDKKQSTNKKKRLRKKSSTKKRDKELALKIDKFNMNDDINEIPAFKEQEEEQSGTPEKLTDEDQKINMAYSSSKKVQKFETPINLERGLSRVGIKSRELEAEEAMASKKKSSEVKYIVDNPLSNAQKSDQGSKKLSGLKRIGDVAGSFGDLCISSKSVLGLQLQRSSVELLNEGRSSIEMIAPIDPYKDIEKISNNKSGDEKEGKEKYSPIWSSINRKRNDSEEKKPVKIENCKPEIGSFPGMGMAPINQGLSRHTSKQGLSRQTSQQKNATSQKPKLNTNKFDEFSEGKVSQASKTIQALVSQREKSITKSKQKSFNSPTSLNYNIDRERCRNSIDNSTIKKGRKLVMLDEAGVSKQSLQFGKSNQSSLLGNILSGTGSSFIRSPTRNVAKINQTSKNMDIEARHNSQVEFDVGGCDFEQQGEDEIDIDNVEDIANSLFSKPAAGTQAIRCENQGILPRKKTKGTILVLRPEDQSNLDISSQGLGQTFQSSMNKKAMNCSIGADSAINHEVNKSINENGQDYSGNKTGQTAFQRLVLASKKIIKERSSSKKDRGLRSNSQNQTCKLENINGSASSKKLSTRNDEVGFYARPFSITKERSCEKSPGPVQRSTTEPPKGKVVHATAHTMASLKALADLSKNPQLKNQNTEYSASQIDQIKEMTIEQDSLDVDRRIKGSPSSRFDKSQSMLTSNYDNKRSKMRINADSALTGPIREFSEKEISSEEYKSKIDLKSRMRLREGKITDSQFTLNNKDAGTRPNKFIGQKNGRNNSVYAQKQNTRRPSHATENQKSMGEHQRNKTQSSVDRSEDSFSGGKMDMVKEEEEKDGERAQRRDRVEDQRRRLESFLTLARQSKSRKDIAMIKDMIHQLDETKKPLPMSRVNDLKQLELMASPYNQSLISMIKVEVDQAKKLRDMRLREKQQRKFNLPKHSVEKSHDEQNVFKLGSDESRKQSHLGSHDVFRGDHISKVMGGPSNKQLEVQEPIRTARNKVERSPYARKHKSPLHSVRPGQNNDRSAERIVFQNIGSSVLNQEHRKSIDRLTCESCSQRGITPMQEKALGIRNTITAHESRNSRGLNRPSETLSPDRSGPGSFMNQLSQKMSKDNIRSQTSLDLRHDHSKEPFAQ